MKSILAVLFIFLILGCQKFEKQNAQQILENEKQHINWNEVDIYPGFEFCKEGLSKEKSFLCFTENIGAYLNLDQCLPTQLKNTSDCFQLHLSVSKSGEIIFDSLASSTKNNLKLSQKIDSCISKLEPVYPAQKRSVPVKLSFDIPLQFK
ncbi:hypothetical protein [Psychroflexus halocasei]|uniref:TonB protein C-terminal n=1 Tax=Psychroflexus halocasei TaxID=908615 RepID=A0A1H4D224_9FLAO|nr:hypothetical protein [Psychroflexus halocasei]SEA66764.1 hypothetical protein SAMN05421540_10985 [Psychroflexus halocasei]